LKFKCFYSTPYLIYILTHIKINKIAQR
jgi:hypothetical protein